MPRAAALRPVLSVAVAATGALVLAACGGSSSGGARPSTSKPTSAAASSSATTSPSPSVDLATADLVGLLAPAPAGFHVSTDASDDNGTITPAKFDQLTDTGDATRLGYSTGQAVTYTDGTSSVEYDLLRFATDDDATAFAGVAKADDGVEGTDPTIGTDASIPGSVVVAPTKADPSGDQAEYDLFAPVRDGLVLVTSYYVDAVAATDTTALESYAQVQVARL